MTLPGQNMKIFFQKSPVRCFRGGMRTPRIKIDDRNTWYHCHNRVVGNAESRPFGDAEKEQFVRLLKEVSELFGVRVVAYQVMCNHYHLLLHAPVEMFSPKEMCRRYHHYYRNDKTKVMKPDDELCEIWRNRTRDISWFMRLLQQKFTMWFNASRSMRRRGTLWSDRYGHVILQSGKAVWKCWQYIENNPVKAGMVEYAGDYRFCSFGAWRQSGRHPFQHNLIALVLPMLDIKDLDQLFEMLRQGLTAHLHNKQDVESTGKSSMQRVRFWTKGVVIGSELFVRDTMANFSKLRSRNPPPKVTYDEEAFCSWRKCRLA